MGKFFLKITRHLNDDDEKALSKTGVVAISVGAERTFRIRDKTTKKIIIDIHTVLCAEI